MSGIQMRSRVVLVLAAILVGLTGCSEKSVPVPVSSPSSPITDGSPSPTGNRFDTAAAVIDAMRSGGVACSGYETIPIDEYDERALQTAFCKTPEGFELNASVYANSADAQSSPQRLFDKPAQSLYGSYAVVGKNWSVMVAADGKSILSQVQAVIGGQIVEIAPTK